MAESEAQRKARERNLRLGNPRAYEGAALGGAEDPPREDDSPAQSGSQSAPRTFRGRAKGGSQSALREKPAPKAGRTRPRASGRAQSAPRAAKGGGFFDGFLSGLGG